LDRTLKYNLYFNVSWYGQGRLYKIEGPALIKKFDLNNIKSIFFKELKSINIKNNHVTTQKINILINNIKIQLQTNIFINNLGCYFS